VRYCENENIFLILECNSNAHCTAWGSSNCNNRGEALVLFLNSPNMEILNRGNEFTFCSGPRQEVIDITLGSFGLLEIITGWEVYLESSLSDHRHLLFNLRGPVSLSLIRNSKGTNWGSFQEGLTEKLERGPGMNMKDESVLGLAVHWVQQALISADEENCLLRPANYVENL